MTEYIGIWQRRNARDLAVEIRATAVIAKQRAIEANHADDWLALCKITVLATQLHALLRHHEQHNAADVRLPLHATARN